MNTLVCPNCHTEFSARSADVARNEAVGVLTCCSLACAQSHRQRQLVTGRVGLTAPERWLQRAYSSIYRQSARLSATRRADSGIPFSLTKDEFNALIDRAGHRCEVTGHPFQHIDLKERPYRYQPWYPSLDRIDPTGIYEACNCRLVCAAANRAMGAWGEHVLARIAQALYPSVN